jgi:BCL2-associated athanogene 2
LDARVERLRKEALQLQEKRELLLLSMDLLKNNDLLSTLSESKDP